MDGSYDDTPDYDHRVLQVALACFMLAGSRDDRDLKVLLLLGQETFAKGRDRVRLTMRELVPGARTAVRNLMDALDRLTSDGLVIREREPGANAASHYSIDVERLVRVAEAYDDATNGVVTLPPEWAAMPITRKRRRVH